MRMQNRRVSVPCFIMLSAGCAMGQTWSHDPAAVNGPLNWGAVTPSYETCGSQVAGTVVPVGMAQTPIDLPGAASVLALLPGVQFHYEGTAFEVENTGHVVEVVY